jgi:hypothetical protein
MPTRYRADLADVAWAKEHAYGVVPPSTELGVLATGSQVSGNVITSEAGMLRGQWGLVTGGIDLPTPTYDWQPFYGIGVMNRNMLFPIQGRERLEGRISQTLLCHDSSRLFLEQMIGLAFNAKNADLASQNTVNAYTPTTGTSIITATTFDCTGDVLDPYTPATDSGGPPTHIIIVSDVLATPPNRTQDTWAYIGETFGGGSPDPSKFYVWKNPALTEAGWNGVRPPAGSACNFSIHGIGQASSATGVGTGSANSDSVKYVTRDANVNKHIFIRPTLVQSSFTLGARFRADDGSSFVTNYSGCKVSRAVFNFEEGAPVNFGADFIARDMSHNIGEHDAADASAILAANEDTLKYKPIGTAGTNTIQPNYMKNIRVTEQPYFYSTVSLTFHGEAIARFRRFTITIDNGLEARYYITQNDAATPRDNRQILHEILEGRRGISFGGSLDLDDDGSDSYPSSTTPARPTDATFLRYLLNQGMSSTDIRDMDTLKGIGITVELRKLRDASGNSNAGSYDKIKFHIGPVNNTTNAQQVLGDESDVSMVIRSAPHNIPAPPSIHVPVDIDGMASSMFIEIMDGVLATD